MPRALVPSLLLAALALAACSNAAKREAATLDSAVEAYRRTEGPNKTARARAVAEVSCTDAKVCDAKAACVDAIDTTMRAIALKDDVAARIADIEAHTLAPDSPEAKALPGKLDEAERLLRQGRDKMRDCDQKLVDLRVAYGG